MERPTDIEKYIDRFHAGEISAQEFNTRLASDVDLRAAMELHTDDLRAIRAAAREDLKLKAAAALQQHEQKSAKVFPIRRVLLLAASVFLLVSAVFIINNNYQSSSPSELFVAHFELPSPSNARAAEPGVQSWNEAMKAYADQDFPAVVNLLSALEGRPDATNRSRGKLYLGIAYLMTDELPKGIAQFEQVSAESSYWQDANWYRALSYLKMDEVQKAKTILQEISNQPKHFKKAAADKILKSL